MGKKKNKGLSNETLVSRIILVIYIGVLSYLCFARIEQDVVRIQELFGIPVDKVVHFLMFFPFPWIAYFSLGRDKRGLFSSIILILGIFILGCFLAAATEIIQSHIPYRSADPFDFKSDTLSLAISSLLVFVLDLGRKLK